MAEAGPAAASSGVEPGMVGKPLGSVSQMRPQSVSVWLVAELPLAAAGALADEAVAAVDASALGLPALGDADPPADEHAASASDAARVRPIARRCVVAWRRWALIGPSYPRLRRVRT
jgi:hypothetical protein